MVPQKMTVNATAAKRLLNSIAAQYGKRDFIILEDALSANGPHIMELQKHSMDYIIVAKPGNNASLFKTMQTHLQQAQYEEWEHYDDKADITRGYRIYKHLALNNTHKELFVDVLWSTGKWTKTVKSVNGVGSRT